MKTNLIETKVHNVKNVKGFVTLKLNAYFSKET